MKFAEHLTAHITPEWRKQYINYEEMKAMLYMAVEEAPSVDSVEDEVLKRHFANFDENFFHYCDKELKKINTFYSEKLAEATRKFATLKAELKTCIEESERSAKKSKGLKKAGLPHRKAQELKLAFSEFYLSLILLQNYQNLNHTGFRKILKKHDKLLRVDTGAKWRQNYVESSHFFINKDIDNIINETETTVTTELEGGDRQRAMKRLRVPPLGEQQSPWTTFKVGLFSGSFVVLGIVVVLSAIFHDISGETLKATFRLYRGPLLIIEFIFLIGVNIYGWRSSGVNHVLIFELDPRNHLSEQHLMELAAIFGVIWTLSMLSFLYSSSLSIPAFINPLTLTIVMVAFLINPFHVLHHDARFWLLRISGRMIAAPFFHVGFADFWLGDQLNSLVTALLDFEYLICFYFTNGDWFKAVDASICMEKDFIIRPIFNCLPAWFRFAQCLRRYRDTREAFPHLVNAGKYSTTFLVVIFATLKSFNSPYYSSTFDNPYTYMWIAASVISSCYSYTWDIKMDWGLFDKNAGENTFLREEIVYSSTGFYYFAIVEDLLLRFSWALSFYITEMKYISGDIMTSVTGILEVFRRFVWNFFRLENEHLNNCGKFRAVRDISIAPIDSSDQTQILRMMDEQDGVINRYTKTNRPKPKKSKDPEKRSLLQPRGSLQDLTIDIDGTKKDLKNMILNALKNAPVKEISTDHAINNYFGIFEEEFFFECENELRKINTFYAEKLAEAKRRNDGLATALDEVVGEFRLRTRTMSRKSLHEKNIKRKTKQKKSNMSDIRNGLSELYLSLVLLQNYKMLNYTGFKKILKKHDKLLINKKGRKWFEDNISTAYFYKNNELDGIMQEVEHNFTEYLENGDRTEAMKRLRVPPLDEAQQLGTVFRVGLFLGAVIILMGFILILAFYGNLDMNYKTIQLELLFRGPFYIVMYLFLIGINVFCWRRAGVNHILIFEINPRKHLTYSNLLEIQAILSLIWCLGVLGFIYADYIQVSRLIFPLLITCVILVFLLNPLPIFHRNTRYWLLRLIARVTLAPLYPVGFADFWFGDQLNSMVACLLDFKYLLCFYIYNTNWSDDIQADQCLEGNLIVNAIVRCVPSWFRFAQCLRRYSDTGQAHPFLTNAGKYAATFPMVIFLTLSAKYKENYEHTFENPFIWFYLILAIFQTCYCCSWDILWDFGLLQTTSGKNIFLREQIIYPSSFYYFVVVENLILRFFWAISLYFVTNNYINVYNMESLSGCLEIVRRYIWNYVRLENEHLYNVGQFRAVRDIFIEPIVTKNSMEIENMMDKENGVLNRSSKKYNNITLTDDNEVLED
ncbi:solute carrier family 53 member 1-like [Cochliomyia hominivorax]